ncbi:MAG: hypothetical protein ACRC8S_15175 [Fimbriiglobus sp.]
MLVRCLILSMVFVLPLLRAQEEKPAKPVVTSEQADKALLEALQGEKIFLKGEGKLIRAAYTKHFEATYAEQIKLAFDEDTAAIQKFLDANVDIKEMLFTAIDPEVDNVIPALELFRKLYKLSPEKLKAHPNVAVAVAVTWDEPRGVYDYRGHQIRTKSDLPVEVMETDAIKNYEMVTKIEGPMKQAVSFFPWEFMLHIVNHRTPQDERDWATKNYFPRRSGIGKSYFDIEYDQIMLRTNSEVCKLNDKPYTLPSIRKHGGVCAMQADFAARVAKSLVVPAEYVWGESNSGGLHAWVMWVEVKTVNKEKIDFALMSEGRYLGDQYYVGKIRDPKSGAVSTDRDMERRLTFIGYAPQNARHADLLMRAFPLVRDQKKLNPKQQAEYLRKVHEIFPQDEKAWLALADLGRNGHSKETAFANADRAVKIFEKFPDFSWKILDDLLSPLSDKTQRTRLYERIVTSYELLSRPDLACEARLKLVEYQVEAKEYDKAITGLANTIRKFPGEGRYIPQMMTKLTETCALTKTGTEKLAKFYLEFLPAVPKRRGDEVSKYCVKMHEQAIEFFDSNNKPRESAAVKAQLQGILSGRK